MTQSHKTDFEPQMSLDAGTLADIVVELDDALLSPSTGDQAGDRTDDRTDDRAGAVAAPIDDDIGEDVGDGIDDDRGEELVLGEPLKPQIDMTLKAMAEAIIFASDKPIKEGDILPIIQTEQPDIQPAEIRAALAELVAEYKERRGGFVLESLKGQGYQFRTVKDAAPLMMNKFASRPRPLSKAAMETLAIVAYRQPVTRADVEFIRGVDAGNIIKNLLERDLIKCTGRKEDTPGKPMQFGTSGEFLRVFRLQSIKELPPLSSFQPHKDDMDQASEQLESRPDADEAAAAFIEGPMQGPLLEGEKQLLLSGAEAAITTTEANTAPLVEAPAAAEEIIAAEPAQDKEKKSHLTAEQADEEFGDELIGALYDEPDDDDDGFIELEVESETDD